MENTETVQNTRETYYYDPKQDPYQRYQYV